MTICERLAIGMTSSEMSGTMKWNEYATLTDTRQPGPSYGALVLLQPVLPPAQVVVTVSWLGVMPQDASATYACSGSGLPPAHEATPFTIA
jgi:hypothetical protein